MDGREFEVTKRKRMAAVTEGAMEHLTAVEGIMGKPSDGTIVFGKLHVCGALGSLKPEEMQLLNMPSNLSNVVMESSPAVQPWSSQSVTCTQSRAIKTDMEASPCRLQDDAVLRIPQQTELRKEADDLRFQNDLLRNQVSSLEICNEFLLLQEQELKDHRDAFETQVEHLYKEKVQCELQKESQQKECGLMQEELQILGGIHVRLQDQKNKLEVQLKVLQENWKEHAAAWEEKLEVLGETNLQLQDQKNKLDVQLEVMQENWKEHTATWEEKLQISGGTDLQLQDEKNKLDVQLEVMQENWKEHTATWEEKLQISGGTDLQLQDEKNKLDVQLEVLQENWKEHTAAWEKKLQISDGTNLQLQDQKKQLEVQLEMLQRRWAEDQAIWEKKLRPELQILRETNLQSQDQKHKLEVQLQVLHKLREEDKSREKKSGLLLLDSYKRLEVAEQQIRFLQVQVNAYHMELERHRQIVRAADVRNRTRIL